ncbi:hypothetical protein KP509_24G028600 [Ceratopteris richardii]|nr:hypothetical protein KP509_24G028600 [Ceratopteris richardii]
MFDRSNGKDRVFFHPAVAKDLFGSGYAHNWDAKGINQVNEVETVCSTSIPMIYNQIVEEAFASLHNVRFNRQNHAVEGNSGVLLPDMLISPQNPRVPEAMVGRGLIHDLQGVPNTPAAFETLVCEEKSKVFAVLPSAADLLDCAHCTISSVFSDSVSSHISCPKRIDTDESEAMQDNTEDLDALLSSDDDDDEDIRSTGHSPDDLLEKDWIHDTDDEYDVQQYPCKRRRISDDLQVQSNVEVVSAGQDCKGAGKLLTEWDHSGGSRRQKIKSRLRALRRMIPGGAALDTAFVLDMTIRYVRSLRDRVNQLEAMRIQSQSHVLYS